MTSATNSYNQLTREELINLLETRDRERVDITPYRSGESHVIKRIISEVLILLFNEEQNPIEKSMKLLLNFFDADWGYVAIFEKNGLMVDFPCEVKSKWAEAPKDDARELSYETIPWIISTVKSNQDIVLCNMDDLPPEAHIDGVLLKKQQLKSMLAIPLTFRNQVQGFIGFDSVRVHRLWTAVEVEDMHLIANIFSIIIERWQTQTSLEESQKHLSELGTKFRQFFDNLPIGVELYDADGFLIDINKANTQIFGTSRQELLGINLFENPNIPPKILKGIRNGKAFSFQIVYHFDAVQNTRYFPSSLANQVKYLQIKGISLTDAKYGKIGYLLIISDNTEKQSKAEQTKNNLATLKAILLSGRSIVGEYDVEKDEFFVNPALNDHPDNNKLFHFLKANNPVSYKTLHSFTRLINNCGKSTSPLLEIINGTLNNCSYTGKVEIEGDIIWVRINAQAYMAGNGGIPSKIICYITDITEEKVLAEKLYQAEYESRQSELEIQKVREADKLKSAFLANMSHEIRTPLNAIIGFSHIIAETDDAEEKSDYVNIINRNSDLLLRLITDILDFSKIESGVLDYSYTNVNLKEIYSEQQKIHALKVPKGVSLICDFDSLPDIILYTDPRRVTQVISNLISNAIKFTEQGSITLSYKIVNTHILIEITDTGIGIKPENINSIFERFVKIDTFKQGTGLGLTICKTIIEALNGQIGVHSKPGQGSTFWFTLPLVNKEENI